LTARAIQEFLFTCTSFSTKQLLLLELTNTTLFQKHVLIADLDVCIRSRFENRRLVDVACVKVNKLLFVYLSIEPLRNERQGKRMRNSVVRFSFTLQPQGYKLMVVTLKSLNTQILAFFTRNDGGLYIISAASWFSERKTEITPEKLRLSSHQNCYPIAGLSMVVETFYLLKLDPVEFSIADTFLISGVECITVIPNYTPERQSLQIQRLLRVFNNLLMYTRLPTNDGSAMTIPPCFRCPDSAYQECLLIESLTHPGLRRIINIDQWCVVEFALLKDNTLVLINSNTFHVMSCNVFKRPRICLTENV